MDKTKGNFWSTCIELDIKFVFSNMTITITFTFKQDFLNQFLNKNVRIWLTTKEQAN